MTIVSSALRNLIGGVSQYPSTQRQPNQCSAQENMHATPVEGLFKRRPTEFVARTHAAVAPRNVAMGAINRSSSERYVTVVQNKELKVFDVLGNEYPVFFANGATDFDYLDCRRNNRVRSPETWGAGWAETEDALAAVATTVASPVGHGTAVKLEADRSLDPVGTDAVYTNTFLNPIQWDPGPKTVGLTCSFKLTGTALYEVPDLRLMSSSLTGNAVFQWVGSELKVKSTTNGTATSVTAAVIAEDDGWYRACMVMEFTGTGAGSLGTIDISLTPPTGDDGSDMDVYAFGPRTALNLDVDASLFPSYMIEEPREAIRSLPVADFTFFTNRTRTVAMDAETTGPRFPDQVVIDSQGLEHTVSDIALAFIRQGGYGERYHLRSVLSDGLSEDVTVQTVHDPDATDPYPSGALKDQASNKIADEFADIIDPAPGGNEPEVTSKGSIVLFRATAPRTFTRFRADDSQGDTLMVAIHDEVQSIGDLPTNGPRGLKVRVVGSNADDEDDYWVEFVYDNPGDAVGVREGHWSESVAPDIPHKFDASTMPHQLVRKEDDDTGSVTDIPGSLYFEWGPATWSNRLVGDETTNPEPSFVGNQVRDLAFYRGRLAFVAGDTVVFSEVGEFFNFWRTTVRTLVDSDPIDTDTPHPRAQTLNAAVPVWETLLVTSAGLQTRIDGSPLLTPKTVSTTVASEFENSPDVPPVVLGQTVALAVDKDSLGQTLDDYSAVLELFRVGDGDVFSGRSMTEHVPQYLRGQVTMAAASPSADAAVFVTDDDASVVYVHSHVDSPSGSRLQDAWFKYVFPDEATILGVRFIENTLLLLVSRAEVLELEKLTLAAYGSDTGSTYSILLDRRVSELDLVNTSFNNLANETTFTLPYTFTTDSITDNMVITRPTSTDVGGEILDVVSVSGNQITVEDDHRTSNLWFGERYTMLYRFSAPVVRERVSGGQSGFGGLAPILAANPLVSQGRLSYADTASFDVDISGTNRVATRSQFRAPGFGSGFTLGQPTLTTGHFEFAVGLPALEAVIDITSDSPFPCRFQSHEWDLEVVSMYQRSPG